MRRTWLAIALLCSALSLPDPAGAASVNRWEAIGPEGGPVCNVAFAPSNPSIVYAIGRTAPLSDRFGYGLLRSDDGGTSWSLKAPVQGGGYECGLDVSATDPNVVATTYGMTTDGGRTFAFGRATAYRQTAWNWTGTGPSSYGFAGRARAYISADSYSADGVTWFPLPAGRTITVAPNPVDPRNAVAVHMLDSAPASRVVVTHDGGRSWSDVTTEDPAGLPRTPGFPWTPLVRNLDGVFFDPLRNGRAYAGLGGGSFSRILVSDDGGSSWRQLSPTDGWDQLAVVRDATTTNLFARNTYGANPGTWLSRDGGVTWTLFEAGSTGAFLSDSPTWSRILGAAPDPFRPGRVLYGDASGIWESLDGARSWKRAPNHGIHGHRWQLFGSGDHVYAPNRTNTTWQGVLHSSDGGASWTELPVPSSTRLLATDPNDNRTVLAWTTTGLIVSRDAGTTWNALHDSFWTRSFSDAAISGSSITLAGGSWTVRSRDAGASWTEQPWWTYRFGPTSSGDPASCDGEAKIDPLDHAHLTLTPPALYGCVFSWAESRDGGVTWTQHDAPNPWDPPSTPLRPGASIAFGLTPSGSFVPPGEGIATRVVPTLPNPLTGEDQITSVVPISATRVLAGTEFGLVSMTMAEPLVLNTPTLVRTDGIVTCGFSDTSAVPPVGFRVQIERDGSPTGQDQLRPDTAPAGTYRCHARAVGPFGTMSSTFSEAITVVPTPTEEPSETEGPRTDALSLTGKGLQVVGSLRLGTTARCGGVALASRVRVQWALKHGRRVMRVTRPALAIRRRLLGWRLRCSVVGPSAPTVSAWRTIPPA